MTEIQQDAARWRDHTCSHCGKTLTRGTATYNLCVRRYEPMPDGPEWVAVGDWSTPEPTGPILCQTCERDVIWYALTNILGGRSER